MISKQQNKTKVIRFTSALKKISSKIKFRSHMITLLAVYAILIIVSYEFIYPLMRMLAMSMMSPEDIINPTVEWIPKKLSFTNLTVAAKVLKFPLTLINSIWFSGLMAACQTVVSAFTGFAFARFNFRFKKFWFLMMLLSFVIPVPLVLIPRVMMFVNVQQSLGIQMIGTVIPQTLLSAFGQGIYSTILILIFYRFFCLIPITLDEAASIDGASPVQIFFHIAIRMSLSTILVVFLLSMVWNWNETYVTSTFLRNGIQLLPTQLNTFDSTFGTVAGAMSQQGKGGEMRINEAYKMAATLISIAPLLILYTFVQKRFIEGIESAGITGE